MGGREVKKQVLTFRTLITLVEIPATKPLGLLQAVLVSTHREGCNVDDPTTQEVGKLPSGTTSLGAL